jgi:hypothetical protein
MNNEPTEETKKCSKLNPNSVQPNVVGCTLLEPEDFIRVYDTADNVLILIKSFYC